MTASTKVEGTQLAVISTEHVLATITDAGSYVLDVDNSAMTGADRAVVRVYKKVRASTALGLAYTAVLVPWAEPISLSIPVASVHEYEITLEQTAGLGKSFPWAVTEL